MMEAPKSPAAATILTLLLMITHCSGMYFHPYMGNKFKICGKDGRLFTTHSISNFSFGQFTVKVSLVINMTLIKVVQGPSKVVRSCKVWLNYTTEIVIHQCFIFICFFLNNFRIYPYSHLRCAQCIKRSKCVFSHKQIEPKTFFSDNKYRQKFHGLVLELVGLIDAKGIDVA